MQVLFPTRTIRWRTMLADFSLLSLQLRASSILFANCLPTGSVLHRCRHLSSTFMRERLPNKIARAIRSWHREFRFAVRVTVDGGSALGR